MTITEDEVRFEDTAALCPVCQWPDEDAAKCPVCGWKLLGGYVAGAATEADHRSLENRLAAERQRHDVRAAVRAVRAGGGNDAARLSWLASCARGGAPSTGSMQRIATEIERENMRLPAAWPGADFALTRLVAGESNGLAFVEIGPDAISACVLVADKLGAPHRRPAGSSVPWSGLLPGLSPEIDLARFRLAGGIGSAAADGPGPSQGLADPAALREAADDAVASAIATILRAASAEALSATSHRGNEARVHGPGAPRSRAPRLDVILVRRTRGWSVLDAITRQAWAHARPIAEIYQDMAAGSLGGIVDLIARRTPLRYAYDLILAQVDAHSGAVRLQPRQLFPAATVVRTADPPTVAVDVVPPPHAADIIELPIVARRGDRDAGWPLVDSHFIDGTVSSPTQLQIRMHRPGQLETSATPDLLLAPAGSSGWPKLLGRLPSRLRPLRALDLVFLVELGGYEDAAVARRIALIRQVIDALRVAASEAAVEVAVIGYRDHNTRYRFGGRDARDQLVIAQRLTPAATAAGILDRDDLWARVDVQDDYAAPLECALRKLAEDVPKWRPGAQRAALIVGSRPPHPRDPDPGSLVRVCPLDDSDWRRDLNVIRQIHAVRWLVVVDDPPLHDRHEKARRYIEQAWREFPAERLFPIKTVSPTQLVQAVGLAPDSGATRLGLAVSAEPSAGSRSQGGGQ
jgi:hypothetical protein